MPTRIAPSRMALEIAHRFLALTAPLDEALKHPSFKPILENVARRHMQRLAQRDIKKLQANDNE